MKFEKKKETFKLYKSKGEGLSGKSVKLSNGKQNDEDDEDEEQGYNILSMNRPGFSDEEVSLPRSKPKSKAPVVKKKKKSPEKRRSTPVRPVSRPKAQSYPDSSSVSSLSSDDVVPSSDDENDDDDEGFRLDDPSVIDEADDDDMSDFASVVSALTGLSSSVSESGSVNQYGLNKEDMEEAEKQDLITKFYILKSQGVRFTKHFTINSSLSEMRMEMGRIEHERKKKQSIKSLETKLLLGSSGLEKLMTAPFLPKMVRGKLNGFSKYAQLNVGQFADIFDELTENYGGFLITGRHGNPIIDMFVLIAKQIAAFIVSSYHSKPRDLTEEEVRTKYPSLVKSIAETEAQKIKESLRQYAEEQKKYGMRENTYAAARDRMQQMGQTGLPASQSDLARPSLSSIYNLSTVPNDAPESATPVLLSEIVKETENLKIPEQN